MKKLLNILCMIMLLVSLVACNKDNNNNNNNSNNQGCDIIDDDCGGETNTDGLDFKQAYESLNGKENKSGKVHRSVTIPEDNPFIKVEPEKIIELINNNETFYLYVGDELCPWCRSVLEKAIEIAKQANVDKIYYVEIWDDEGNEILRDQYKVEDGKLVQSVETSETYQKLLDSFNDVLSDYTLTVDDKEYEVGEKRIYAPNFFYIENGKAIKMVTGISDLQEDSRGDLTPEIIKEEEETFKGFFGV